MGRHCLVKMCTRDNTNYAYHHGCIIDSVSCWQTGWHCFIYFACGLTPGGIYLHSSFVTQDTLQTSDFLRTDCVLSAHLYLCGALYPSYLYQIQEKWILFVPHHPHPTFRVIVIQSNRCQKGTAEALLYV